MKICVCAIAKNEINNVDAWYESVKEADYIAVLDTGSIDGTFEKLKELGIIVEQKIFEHFRWDDAKNWSMKLVPKDADLIQFIDLDERFDSGWTNIIKENWMTGKHVQAKYTYVQNHDKDGNPNMIHSRTWLIDNSPLWSWRYPIHEELWRSDATELPEDCVLDLTGKLVLHHWQDTKKSRAFYNQLFEERIQENQNQMSMYYYGLYQMRLEHWKEAIIWLKKVIQEANDGSITDVERSECGYRLGICYARINQGNNSLNSFIRAIQIKEDYLPPYCGLMSLYEALNSWDNIKKIYDKAKSLTTIWYKEKGNPLEHFEKGLKKRGLT